MPSSVSTGVNNPGIASDARTAFSVEPLRSQTSAPFSSDVATAANGIFELLDRAVLEAAADERHESLPFEQPAAEADVRERQHVAAPHPGRAGAEAIELAARIGGADERADRRAADEIGPNSGALERAHDADVRPAARRAAAQYEAESRQPPLAHDKQCHGLRFATRNATPRTSRTFREVQIACRGRAAAA